MDCNAASLASIQATISATYAFGSGKPAASNNGALSTPASSEMTESPKVYAELARVAAVTLNGILKSGPNSGKGKKKGPPTFAP